MPTTAPWAFQAPLRPVRTDLSRHPVTTFEVDLGALADGPPTQVPWSEFSGNPETGTVQALHVGKRAIPIKDDGYLREVAVWRSGVAWYQDFGLRFVDWAGNVSKVRGVPASYDQLAFASHRVYFVQQPTTLRSWSPNDATPQVELDLADFVGQDAAGSITTSSVRGLLADDDPVVRVIRRIDGERVARLFSRDRGTVPLPPWWWYTPGSAQVGSTGPSGRIWSGYDDRTYEPLWSRRYVNPPADAYPPSGMRLGPDKVLVPLDSRRPQGIVVDARSGEVLQRLRFPPTDSEIIFEDPRHFIYTAYDGTPNPNFDPSDPFPEVDEIDYPNVLVRCSVRGFCERAARVEPRTKSLTIGITHLSSR